MLATAAGAYVYYTRSDHPPARPNIVLITIDTLRADRVGAYGYAAARTPALDELAGEGARFETALAHVPLTLPSHATMLTGLLPPASGVRDNGATAMGGQHTLVSEILASSGYRTAAIVSGFPLDRRFGLARGFQTYEDRMPRGKPGRAPFVERQADRTVDIAIETIETLGEPFFLWVHMFDPHAPYEPPVAHGSDYDGEIAFVDSQIARLRAEPKLSSAVWIVTSDHGESLGEHGEETHGLFVYDSTMRVPLIVAGPGIRARVVKEPAMLVDIAPTVVKLAGCESTAAGSFAGSYLLDKLDQSRAVYGESLFGRLNCGWAPLLSVRRDGWKYIDAPRAELYDMLADPAESRNLLDDEHEKVACMRVELEPMRGGETAEPGDPDSETARRLASLGYISGGGAQAYSGKDPKDTIGQANRLERALAAVQVRPAEAERELRRISEEEPANSLARRHWAAALAAMQRYREAAEVLAHLAEDTAASADVLAEQAEYFRLDGRSQEGIDCAGRAIELDEHSLEAHLAMAKCLATLGRGGEAIAALSKAIAIRPDAVEAFQITADISAARGDFRAAADAMRRVYERERDDSSVAMKYGILLVRAGEPAAAAPVFRGVAEREPSNGAAALSLAGALAKAGDPAGAIQWFERAIANGMRTPACFNGLAMARLEAGDRAGARAAIAESLKLDPNQPQLRGLLAQIER